MTRWTKEEIEYLRSNFKLSPKDVYLDFIDTFGSKRTYNSVQKKLKEVYLIEIGNKTRQAFNPSASTITITDLDELDDEEPIQILSPMSQTSKAKNTKQAQAWLADLQQLHLSPVKPAKPVTSKHDSLVLLLSDFHFGKYTDQYDLDIAADRLVNLPYQLQISPGTIDEIVVALIGDLVEGEDIYSNQNGQLLCSVIEQTEAATEALWKMLNILRDLSRVPIRVEPVPGNHGRMSKSASGDSNWDNVICANLAYLAKNSSILVNKNFKQFHKFTVKDKNIGLLHKGVKHTGTPAMKIKLAGWITSKQLDALCLGHWHDFQIGDWMGNLIINNGCLCGPDDLSERMGLDTPARQGYFLVTPEQPLHGFSFVQW